MMLQLCKLLMYRKNDELRKNAVDALCCLAHALGEDFTIFIPSIHKLLLKHRLRVLFLVLIIEYIYILNIFKFISDRSFAFGDFNYNFFFFLFIFFLVSIRNLRKLKGACKDVNH
jgi:hypothetical protein